MTNLTTHPLADDLVSRAEQEFEQKHYAEAGRLYQQASQADASSTASCRQRWAYCKLHGVVEQLNNRSSAYSALEAEVNSALALAPHLHYGRKLLDEIARRRLDEGTATDQIMAVSIRDLGTRSDGWHVLETTNFRIFYTQGDELAREAARVAERDPGRHAPPLVRHRRRTLEPQV